MLLTMCIAFAAILSPVNDVQEDSVFPGDSTVYPGGEGSHDPTVIEFGGRFFCFCTSGNSFGVMRSSDDMTHWKVEGPILPETPTWLTERYRHRSLWAPDILVLGKKLRMYYCASNWGTNQSVIGLAENDNFNPKKPLEGWHDIGLVMESVPNQDPFNAIDPETIIDESGRHWMFFGSYFGGIYMVELDPTTGKLKNTSYQLVAKNTGERGNPLEGAAVCRRNGYYYLFVSYGLAGQGVRSTYRIMVGRSKEVTGPFLGLTGTPMTEGGHTEVLKSSPPMFSPGHCDVTQDSNGRWLMPYHFYDGRFHWHGDVWGRPALQIRELLMSDDGWPLPGLPIGYSTPKQKHLSAEGTWTHQADFGDTAKITLKKDGTIQGGGKWEQHGNDLILHWPRKDDPTQEWTDKLMLAYNGNYYVGRNQAGLIVRGFRGAH